MTKNIFNLTIEQFNKSLRSEEISVCVIGIGRIGLPTALSFAKSGLDTVGLDINTDLVSKINSGEFPLKDEPKYDVVFNEVLKNKKFHASTKANETIPKSDVILLSLPTPMDQNNIPDYSASPFRALIDRFRKPRVPLRSTLGCSATRLRRSTFV